MHNQRPLSTMGIYDRDYIRDRSTPAAAGARGPFGRTGHPATWWLLAINGAVFLGVALLPSAAKAAVLDHVTLSANGVFGRGYAHTLLTSSFFHLDIGHALVNLVLLWFLGRTLEEEPAVGSRNLVWLYLLGALAGSALFLALPVQGRALGASDAILALATVAALAVPHRQVSLFGLVTVPMMAFAVLVAVLTLLPVGARLAGGLAYLAPLGGAAAGFLYYTVDLRLVDAAGRARLRVVRWLQRKRPPGPSAPPAAGSSDERDPATQARMDALLQKISSQGIEALTDEEREFLNRASRSYKNGH